MSATININQNVGAYNGEPNLRADTNKNTNFYNKYLLQNQGLINDNYIKSNYSPASDIEMKNVLKDQFSLNYTDYEKLKLAQQYNKLYASSLRENEEEVRQYENKKFYNMSLKLLLQNASQVYIDLINELSNYFTHNDEKTLNKLGYIITKGENMIYIGLLVVVIAFSLWFIDITA